MPNFSATVMDHFLHPRGAGTLAPPCVEGWSGNQATSRFMRIQVRIENGVITEARFGTYGCAAAIAAGSYLCEWVMQTSVEEALVITAEQLNDRLGGLPPVRRFCTDLAVDALRCALTRP